MIMQYSSKKLVRVLCLDDFETEARKFLPRPLFEYVSGATETNFSREDNRQVFNELAFVPRVLLNVAKVNTGVSLWGQSFDAPFGISPMGISALTAYRGDLVQAQAAQQANIPMIMSGSSLIRLEDVAKVGKNIWFQAYLPGTAEQIEALIDRVARAGFETLVITVDTPVAANRENNVRAGFSTPLRPTPRLFWEGITHPRWTIGTFLRTLVNHGIPHFENNYATRGVPVVSRNVLRDFSDRGHLNWDYFDRVRAQWKGRIVVKGSLSAEDSRKAVDHGADGLIVSNHGGRQLDCVVSPLRVLPSIVRACPSVPVMFDSGIRRGTDVMKAMALGAKFVFVGRPFNYAATIGGQAGVAHAIALLQAEVRRNTAMLGLTDIVDIDARYLRTVSRSSWFTSYVPGYD